MLKVGSRLQRSVLIGIIKKGDAGGLFRVGVDLQIRSALVLLVTETKAVTGGSKDNLTDFKKAGLESFGEKITESL
jgi:hypothetical protein